MWRASRQAWSPWILGAWILLPFLPSLASLFVPAWALSGHDLLFTFGPKMEFAHRVFPSLPWPPLWHPQIYGGHPFAGNPQSLAYYPATFLFLLFGWSLPLASWITAAHVLLSGLFFSALAGRLGASREGAFLGGLAWALGGQSMGRVFAGHLSWTYALPWIPLLFLGLQGAVKRKSRADAGKAGLAAGLLFLCGAPQAAAYTFLGGALFTSWLLGEEARKVGLPSAGKALPLLALGALPALAMGLAQALPTLPFLQAVSPGGKLPPAAAASGSMAPSFLATLLFPAHFGFEAEVGGFSWEQTAYVGVPALLLAFRGLLSRPAGTRLFFLLLLLFSILFALGPAGGIHPLFYRLPFFGAFRTPGRMMLMAAFSLAVLAALGTPGRKEYPPGARPSAKEGIPPAILVPPALFLLFFPSLTGGKEGILPAGLRLLGLLLLLLSALSLPGLPLGRKLRGPGILVFLEVLDLLFLSALPAIQPPPVPPGPPGVKEALGRALDSLPATPLERALYRVDHPDLGLLGLYPELSRRGIDSTRGNYDPAVARDYRRFLDALNYLEEKGGPACMHALDLLAVRYRFQESPTKDPERERDREIAPGVHFLERKGVPPRFRWVRRARILPDPESWWLLHLGTPAPPDPSRTVTFLEGEAPPPAAHTGPGRVRLRSARPGTLLLEVENRGPGYAVLSENRLPGWRAYLDGRPAPLFRADLLFMAVPVEKPGRHELRLEYAPPGASWSFPAAILGILAALLLAAPVPPPRPHQGR